MDQMTTSAPSPHQLVLVTGPSGAGRTTAINVLEDLGFEAIDNLPLSLIPKLFDGAPLQRSMALGVDVRNRDFTTKALMQLLTDLPTRTQMPVSLLYLDARKDVLIRRYSETRRPHPITSEDSLNAGIESELELLSSVRSRSDVLVDTSDMTPHDLRGEMTKLFGPLTGAHLAVSVQSFSYKRGVPHGVDMVFDCRFLQNPHWQEELRAFTGRDAPVADYVQSDEKFDGFFDKVLGLTTYLLPAYRDEGKAYLTIGFGCTGGKHRSVAVTEMLGKALANKGWQVSIRHRELERRG